MQTITIAGQSFNVSPRYAEGHTLNANEASALNQTYFENLRNNFASRVKEATEAGVALNDLQSEFDTYAEAYQFGVRTGGGRSSDPVQTVAMEIARETIREAIRRDPTKKLSEIKAAAITAAAAKLLEKRPAILDQARERVAQMRAAAGEALDVDVLEGLDTTPAADGEETEAEVDTEASEEGNGKRGRRNRAA